METQTINTEIHQTLENIYNFVKENDKTKEDFTEYKKTIGMYDATDEQLKEFYVTYIFERSIPDLQQNPIMLYNETNGTDISKAMEKSLRLETEITIEIEIIFKTTITEEKIITISKITAI